MRVNLFIPCFIDQLYPETAFNTIKVLEKAGCTVNYNPNQTCCGQPSFNSGYWKETRALARKFLTDFNQDGVIISPSGSCTAFVKNHYHKLFKDDPEMLSRVKETADRCFELSDFLVNHLNVTKFGASFPHKVTFHDSCHALREYGIKEEPRILLQNVEGLELIEMEESDTCCGFGGTFAVKHEPISAAMTQQKVENAVNSGATYVVSTEASCLMNINSYASKNKVALQGIHLADILAHGI